MWRGWARGAGTGIPMRSYPTGAPRITVANEATILPPLVPSGGMHQMGHVLGYDDIYVADRSSSLMYGYLTIGERRLPNPVFVPEGGYAAAQIAE